jgi:predicted porin
LEIFEMKKPLVALAAFAATAAFADATIYGNIDGGIQSANNQSGTKTAFAGAGGMTPTLFGFKGSEDLGGGLKATYILEGSYNAGTGSGTTNVNSNNNLFGREANVGLSGAFGTVKAGLQLDPAVGAFASTDPGGLAQFGSGLQGWVGAGLSAGAAATANSLVNIFDNNMVSYSYGANGFNATLGYAFGGVAGTNNAKSITSLGLTYANGPLALSFGNYTDQDATAANHVNGNTVGAAYTMGAVRLAANYMDVKPSNAISTILETTQTGVGASYTQGAVTYGATYYTMTNKENSNTLNKTTFKVDYALSKATGVYAAVTAAKDNGANFGAAGILDQSGVATAAANATTTTWVVGLHKGF